MISNNILSFLLIILCLFLEGLFSGGEIALVSSDINKIRQKARSGSRSAALAIKLLERPDWFFSTALTGTNICAVVSTTVATALFISIFGTVKGELISVLVMVPTVLIMAEMIPKSICQQHPESMAARLCWFIWAASWVLFPAVYLISRISRGTVRIFTGEKDITPSPYITREGLKAVLADRGPRSDILSREKEMVKRIFDFTEVTAGKIMVPLSTMTALPVTATLREASLLAAKKKYLRIPVYRDQMFNIIGVLHYFDLLKTLQGHDKSQTPLPEEDTIASCIRPAVFCVPETKLAKELLVELQGRGERMAVVVDEYGGAVGIVTIEDILEEIVGEIDDEYGEKLYKKIGAGRYLFNAQIGVEHIKRLMPLDIPKGDYETLGGFLLYKMGKIPKSKETFRYGDTLFVIEDADMKAIREVLIVLPPGMDRAFGSA
ncbi:MAG: hemolysin family protein [Syntrophales bacterium]|nr:hemolysin family protein [Syntrophales bacterium]